MSDYVVIVQQNRKGAGLALTACAVALFLLAISALLITRWVSGQGLIEEIVVTVLLLVPAALIFAAAALFEFATVLPRRIQVGAEGLWVRFATWPLPRPLFFPRQAGVRARAVTQRHHNYAIHPSGRVGQSPIVSHRAMIQYGSRRFGPVDADQGDRLAEDINRALAKTGPV